MLTGVLPSGCKFDTEEPYFTPHISFLPVTIFGLTAQISVSLRVPLGGIYGLLGRNGAGKTTCIRLLVGLLEPEKGSVSVPAEDPLLWNGAVSQRLGYMGESGSLPENITGKRLIFWTKKLYPQWDEALEKRLVKIFRLNLLCRVSLLSLGQQRQLAFFLAVAFRPAVLILDELAANLDVVARRQFLEENTALKLLLKLYCFWA